MVGETTIQTPGEERRTRARRDPESASGAADLGVLLGRAAERLCEMAHAEVVVAIARGADRSVRVVACVGTPTAVPAGRILDELPAEGGAVDLLRPDASPAELAAADLGFGGAVVLGAIGGEPQAAFLVSADGESPGTLRPRTRAILEGAARRLESATAAASAAARLGRLDANVQRLDRLASLGELASEIAHEVRNPLVSVKTFLQLLPERLEDPEFLEGFLQVVTDEVRRIEELIDAVLAHARPGVTFEGEDVSVAPVLETVAALLRHRAVERSLQIETEADAALRAPLSGDVLRQVVLNLALNAVDASPDSGRVLLRALDVAGSLEIRVEDQGPGVEPGLRVRIFEPFFSTKDDRPGGLGLAISRRLVMEAGGSLEVAEAEGGGASFRIRFP
jgi:signal transduction histidine kinase